MTGLVLATENSEFEARVRDALGDSIEGPLRYWRDDLLDDPRECVRALANGGTRVVALGPGLDPEQAVRLAQTFDEQRPDISVLIVAKPSTELLKSALRAGARDVISPETPAAELHEAIERAFSASNRSSFDGAPEPDDRRVIVTLCPKGGAGKTTLSTNLALGLAKAAPGETVILDLDLQFGDVASALGLVPELTFSDATHALDVLDATTLKAHLTSHPDGLFALCAPLSPTDADRLTVAHVEHVVRLLADSFRYVVVDTPSGLDENTLAAMEFATDLVLLSATDIPSIRSTRRRVGSANALKTSSIRYLARRLIMGSVGVRRWAFGPMRAVLRGAYSPLTPRCPTPGREAPHPSILAGCPSPSASTLATPARWASEPRGNGSPKSPWSGTSPNG